MTTNANTAPAHNTALQKTAPASAIVAAAKHVDDLAAGALELFRQANGGIATFATEIHVANVLDQMRKQLTAEVMEPVMALMGSSLGFRSDKTYPVEVVRDCFIESRIRGFSCVGNEWNIISGNFYAAKAGLRRQVTKWPGITDFKDAYDVPRWVGDKGAVVKCSASWKLNGAEEHLDCEIPIKVNAGMGADAILGKAERKLLKRVHDRLSGVNTPEGEVGDDGGGPVIDVSAGESSTKRGSAGLKDKIQRPPGQQTTLPTERQPGEEG